MAQDLLDGADGDSLADELVGWLTGSRRFRAFVEAHRDKIRKKLRGATDAEAQRDVRAELRVAHLLLANRRIELAFEVLGSTRGGPDFTVTFRGDRSFNLEVTRLRWTPAGANYGGSLLTKLRQLPASAPNVVLLATEGDDAGATDVAAAARALRIRADAKDEAFFAARGFDGTRAFYKRYLRLSAVLTWCEGATGDARAALWTNRSARIAFSERAARACVLCLRAG
ncbi:MAG: hypothetical protein ACT4OQ_09395 [Chloroflexota bacterium]